jgi:hypothetical protein
MKLARNPPITYPTPLKESATALTATQAGKATKT